MPRKLEPAAAYYRTSSAANVGDDKDSLRRQQDAVISYARVTGLRVVREFYDPAVSGGDPIDERPGFAELLEYLASNGARIVLVENASRFARDLAVQIAGHDLMKANGYQLIPVDAPDYFMDETPTAFMVRQILGAVAQFEKASLVHKLRKARKRKRAKEGRCEGRKPVPETVAKEARRLARKSPKTGRRRSLRQISASLADLGYMGPSGKPYGAESVKRMLTP